MASKPISRKNAGNTTPDQADYRGHVLFDRPTGHKKEKTVRRMRPEQLFSLFSVQGIQQKIIGYSL